MASETEDRSEGATGSDRRARCGERGRGEGPPRGWSRQEGSLHAGAMFGAAVEAQSLLGAERYPMSKGELVARAGSLGAPEHLRAVLERLPDGPYDSSDDVVSAIRRLR